MASRFFWCSPIDVLEAFRIVGPEIRTKCRRCGVSGMTQREACELAGRIREQRELIRQLTERRNFTHARRLLRLNSRLRKRFLAIVEQAGLDRSVLILK